jgi:diguanylate cyclase (GGDEF)-like protein
MSYKILIIEDSISIINTLKSLLEEELDVEVFVAKSMKESATLLLEQKGKFDIVLADLGLPDAPNGEIIEFMSKFSLPIIVLTGTDDINIEEKFRNKDIVDYVIKDGIAALSYTFSIVKRILHNSKIKVLVVDDSKTFLEHTKELLQRYRFQALTALNGEDALKILDENKDIKIVLTDYLMPKIDGLELTKKIRRSYTKDEISVIIVSNDPCKRIPTKFLKYGANDFLYKGFSNEEFFARINSNIEILELFEEIKNKANKDYLTGLYNRRYLFDEGEKLYEKYKKEEKDFAVALIDIDKFKSINDTYGHDVGDVAIKEIAVILNEVITTDVLISRLGGEEFCILLYNRSKDEIINLLEKIRNQFENNQIEFKNIQLKYTVSIGCSFEFGKNLDEMIQHADNGLYDAKYSGRNKVRYR